MCIRSGMMHSYALLSNAVFSFMVQYQQLEVIIKRALQLCTY